MGGNLFLLLAAHCSLPKHPGKNLIQLAEGAVEIENRLNLRRGRVLAGSMRLLCPQAAAQLLQQWGQNLPEIPGDADIGYLKQGGLGV